MGETRKIAAILVSDVVGYQPARGSGRGSHSGAAAGAAQRSDRSRPSPCIMAASSSAPATAAIIEFRSVVDAVSCAIEVQNGMVERNAGVAPDQRIEFRIGIHLGDVVEESDGDLMGDGVNIAARLEGIAEPGAICLSEDAYRQVKGRLDLAVSDLGPTPTQEHRRADPGLFARSRQARAGEARAGPSARKIRPAAPLDRRLAVRQYRRRPGAGAFRRRGHGEPHDRSFAHSRRFRVARNTAFTYKGKPLDVKTIGRELNVRYVLEGSVQRGGNRMRVNVQLIDAETGNHLWAERFDKPLADLFDMQDEIVARLAGALNAQLAAAEARRAEQAPNPDSMDFYFQGLAWMNKGVTPDNVAQARSFFDRALTADPDNVDALVASARTDALEGALYL